MFPAGKNAQTPEAGFTMWITTLVPPPGSAPPPSMCGTTSSGSHSGISSRVPCSTSAKDSSTRWEGRDLPRGRGASQHYRKCSFAYSALTCLVSREIVSDPGDFTHHSEIPQTSVFRTYKLNVQPLCLRIQYIWSWIHHLSSNTGFLSWLLQSKSIYSDLNLKVSCDLYHTSPLQIRATTQILLFLFFFRSLLSDRFSRIEGPLKFI